MKRARQVVVIGGGITGLSAAYHLQQSGAPLAITVLEKDTRLGGCIFTERKSGFVMEHGADVFLARKPHAAALCASLGLPMQAPRMRRAYVRREHGLYPLPEGFSGLVPVRLGPVMTSGLLSVGAKVRLLLERLVPPKRGGGEESVEAFFVRRYGREVFNCVIAPLLAGLSGGDPAVLSLDAQLPQLRAMEQASGSLLWAQKREARFSGSPLRSLAGGLGTLIDALQVRLAGATVQTAVPVRAIRSKGRTYSVYADDGRRWEADAVLVAVPANCAAPMLESLDKALSTVLNSFCYGATITVQLAFVASQVPRALDASGYLSVPGSGRLVVASTWSSAKLAGRAPADHVLLRVVLGRKRSDPVFSMDNAALIDAAREEVREVLGVTARPVLQRVHRWYRSLPQYTMGHLERCARIEDTLRRHPGLYLAGAAYRGAGIPDCIREAQHAAEALLTDLELQNV